MKRIWVLIMILLVGCNSNKAPDTEGTVDGLDKAVNVADTTQEEALPARPSQMYSNARFRDVEVESTGEHQFRITGKAQLFEAAYSWVVEDGHEELAKGFGTTDAGAPEWGNFSFNIDVVKKTENSTLHLILFEASAEDGSRQHELPVLLY